MSSRGSGTLVAAAMALLAAGTPRGSGATTPAPDGAEIFAGKGNCAACHGEGGAGTPMAPDLTDAGWLHGDGSYESIAAIVRTGVAEPLEARTPMPAMGGATLTDDEIAAVARYVHALAG